MKKIQIDIRRNLPPGKVKNGLVVDRYKLFSFAFWAITTLIQEETDLYIFIFEGILVTLHFWECREGLARVGGNCLTETRSSRPTVGRTMER